jgi:MFS family permease
LKAPPDREQELREEFDPPERSLVAATVTIAATYVYFLVFAQFGFLQALAVLGPGHALVRPVLAAMGLAGIAGGWFMARWFRENRGRGRVMTGFVVAAAAAGLTWVARSPAGVLLGAVLTGAGTGMVTVGLAGLLRREVGGGRLGRCIGTGTGLAYAFCNLPPVFNGTAHAQALLGIAAACTGLIAVQLFEQRGPRQQAGGYDYSLRGKAGWIAIFLTLVGVDSAVFAIIQHTPELKLATWTGGSRLWLNAGVHLAAGVGAGLLLDRRWVAGTVGGAAALLLAACVLLGRGPSEFPLEAGLYAAGVSAYSAALVFYPARAGRPGLAALVYGIAGWIGSAAGLGLAQEVHRVPGWLPVTAGAVVGGLFFMRHRDRRREQAGVQK